MSLAAYTTLIPDGMKEIIFAQIGVQAKTFEESAEFANKIIESFSLSNGPIHFDRAKFTDVAEYENRLFLAYWNDTETYEKWQQHEQVQQWWNGEGLKDSIGLYHEVAKIPVTHFETIHSMQNSDSGVTHFLSLEETKEHAYWGSMRKRIQASSVDNLDSANEKIEHTKKETLGKHLKAIAPNNVSLIRTAQNWTQCNAEERETYLGLVEPALQKAYRYLNTHQEDSGCINPKFVQELDENGNPLDKTCVVSFFLSLKHLEEWTHKHPTHMALFGTFAEMLKRHKFSVQLSLWHEVSVLQSDDLELDYINCHPDTGFLPYFKTKEVSLLKKV